MHAIQFGEQENQFVQSHASRALRASIVNKSNGCRHDEIHSRTACRRVDIQHAISDRGRVRGRLGTRRRL